MAPPSRTERSRATEAEPAKKAERSGGGESGMYRDFPPNPLAPALIAGTRPTCRTGATVSLSRSHTLRGAV